MMTHDPRLSNALSRRVLNKALEGFVLVLTLAVLGGCSIIPPDDPIDPSSPAAGMVRIAEQLRARGDIGGAADFYTRALQRDPNDIVAHRGMAILYDQSGRPAEAAEEYRAVIKLRPHDADARRNLGRELLALEKPAEARDAYAAAIEIEPGDAKAMNGLGIALDYLGEHESAQKQFEAALKEEPDNLTTVNNLAYSLILSGRNGEAIKLLEPHVKDKKASTALRQNLALAYGLSGMDIDAERVAKMDLPPQKVKESLAYYKRKRAEKAVSTAPYAELGTYATEALAEAQIYKLQQQIEESGVDLKPVIAPQLAAPGGTPRFAVRMMGCAKPDDVKVFCDELAKNNIPCVVRGK